MYSVDVHPHVYDELEYSRTWYEERAANLGTEFLIEIDRAIEKVRESPWTWPSLYENPSVKRYLVHRFPYAVIYRSRDRVVQIIAIMHLRRHPDYWRERVLHWNGSD